MKDIVFIYTDGASRNNPGEAAIGVVIVDGKGKVIDTISEAIGVTTNNQAEYRAVIAGLERALKIGAARVCLSTDSELVVKQLQGSYRVRSSELKPLYAKAVRLLGSFDGHSIKHVSRAYNAEADQLANMALDNQKKS